MSDATVEEAKYNSPLAYYWKAFKWFCGNTFFGLFPLLIILLLRYYSDYGIKDSDEQMHHLIKEGGIIVFVMLAIMGAVVVDYFLAGIAVSGFRLFAVYIFPLIILGIISLKFILLCMKKVDENSFDVGSIFTTWICIFSFLYSTVVKTTLFINEDSRN